jgi:hypothetical protein
LHLDSSQHAPPLRTGGGLKRPGDALAQVIDSWNVACFPKDVFSGSRFWERWRAKKGKQTGYSAMEVSRREDITFAGFSCI